MAEEVAPRTKPLSPLVRSAFLFCSMFHFRLTSSSTPVNLFQSCSVSFDHSFTCWVASNTFYLVTSPSLIEPFFFSQGVRSQTSTPDDSPVHRPDKDPSFNVSLSLSLGGDKTPAPSAPSGGFTSWFRSTNAQPSSDRTSAAVGSTKSSATEELVSDNFNADRENCQLKFAINPCKLGNA